MANLWVSLPISPITNSQRLATCSSLIHQLPLLSRIGCRNYAQASINYNKSMPSCNRDAAITIYDDTQVCSTRFEQPSLQQNWLLLCTVNFCGCSLMISRGKDCQKTTTSDCSTKWVIESITLYSI